MKLIIARYLSSAEVSTALRPFYFSVHPDLFAQYPDQRTINENSLKQLSLYLENVQSRKPVLPITVQFYIRKQQIERGKFQLIKIGLRGYDIRENVLKILKACELPTTFVDNIIPPPPPPKTNNFKYNNVNYSQMTEEDPIFGTKVMEEQIKKAKGEKSLSTWLEKNVSNAHTRMKAGKPIREEIERLRIHLSNELHLKTIKWDCGWDISHFRGCLQSFQALTRHHPLVMHVLRGRTIVFAPFTGVSLEGQVMLNIGEVRHNWLDLIKNVKKHDDCLLRIPAFEKAVSRVLRDIKVGRRKFMPKIKAGEYENHLRSITTALNDYLSTRSYPKQWPESLKNYEIVVETGAGPLMLSPTGQFIVPSSCPGFILVNFLSDNLEEATRRLAAWKTNKHIERDLHARVVTELGLASLQKDDNVTPDLMIACCERLLANKAILKTLLVDLTLNISTYYSVMTDGVLCVPWNWKL